MNDRDIIQRCQDQILNAYLDALDGDADDFYEPDPDTMLGGHDNPIDPYEREH